MSAQVPRERNTAKASVCCEAERRGDSIAEAGSREFGSMRNHWHKSAVVLSVLSILMGCAGDRRKATSSRTGTAEENAKAESLPNADTTARTGEEPELTLETVRELEKTITGAFVGEHVPGTTFAIRWRDRRVGEGSPVEKGARLEFSFKGYAEKAGIRQADNEGFRSFVFGNGEAGAGLELALSRMREGSIHEVVIPEEVGQGLRENWPNLERGSLLHVWIELLKVKDQ